MQTTQLWRGGNYWLHAGLDEWRDAIQNHGSYTDVFPITEITPEEGIAETQMKALSSWKDYAADRKKEKRETAEFRKEWRESMLKLKQEEQKRNENVKMALEESMETKAKRVLQLATYIWVRQHIGCQTASCRFPHRGYQLCILNENPPTAAAIEKYGLRKSCIVKQLTRDWLIEKERDGFLLGSKAERRVYVMLSEEQKMQMAKASNDSTVAKSIDGESSATSQAQHEFNNISSMGGDRVIVPVPNKESVDVLEFTELLAEQIANKSGNGNPRQSLTSSRRPTANLLGVVPEDRLENLDLLESQDMDSLCLKGNESMDMSGSYKYIVKQTKLKFTLAFVNRVFCDYKMRNSKESERDRTEFMYNLPFDSMDCNLIFQVLTYRHYGLSQMTELQNQILSDLPVKMLLQEETLKNGRVLYHCSKKFPEYHQQKPKYYFPPGLKDGIDDGTVWFFWESGKIERNVLGCILEPRWNGYATCKKDMQGSGPVIFGQVVILLDRSDITDDEKKGLVNGKSADWLWVNNDDFREIRRQPVLYAMVEQLTEGYYRPKRDDRTDAGLRREPMGTEERAWGMCLKLAEKPVVNRICKKLMTYCVTVFLLNFEREAGDIGKKLALRSRDRTFRTFAQLLNECPEKLDLKVLSYEQDWTGVCRGKVLDEEESDEEIYEGIEREDEYSDTEGDNSVENVEASEEENSEEEEEEYEDYGYFGSQTQTKTYEESFEELIEPEWGEFSEMMQNNEMTPCSLETWMEKFGIPFLERQKFRTATGPALTADSENYRSEKFVYRLEEAITDSKELLNALIFARRFLEEREREELGEGSMN